MRTLSERDATVVTAIAAEIAALREAEPFPPHLLGSLAGLLRTPEVEYLELDRDREFFLFASWWEGGEGSSRGRWKDADESIPEEPGDSGEAFWRLWDEHPIRAYRKRTGDWTSTYRWSDFVSLSQFRRTEIWNLLYRECDVNYYICVGLRPAGAQTRWFTFPRSRGDFDDRDRLVLDLLQPHLQQRHDRALLAADAVQALVSIEEHDVEGLRHVVLCSSGGTIEFASPESRRLLADYLEMQIPRRLLQGGTFAVERGHACLTVRAARVGDLLVLLLGERDLRIDDLTARQRAILALVAEGHPDAQIADRLGVARATVNKHLEQIYRRLDVHTRTAAAALASSSIDRQPRNGHQAAHR